MSKNCWKFCNFEFCCNFEQTYRTTICDLYFSLCQQEEPYCVAHPAPLLRTQVRGDGGGAGRGRVRGPGGGNTLPTCVVPHLAGRQPSPGVAQSARPVPVNTVTRHALDRPASRPALRLRLRQLRVCRGILHGGRQDPLPSGLSQMRRLRQETHSWQGKTSST